MRPLTWLHISDFHFREEETWAQNTVLRAMLDDIQRRCDGGLEVDFVLITGDIAYSGDVSQYALAALFLSDLSKTVNLPLRMIFCVPGNHDVKRDYQKACFLGARQLLQSENEIYTFWQTARSDKLCCYANDTILSFRRSFSAINTVLKSRIT